MHFSIDRCLPIWCYIVVEYHFGARLVLPMVSVSSTPTSGFRAEISTPITCPDCDGWGPQNTASLALWRSPDGPLCRRPMVAAWPGGSLHYDPSLLSLPASCSSPTTWSTPTLAALLSRLSTATKECSHVGRGSGFIHHQPPQQKLWRLECLIMENVTACALYIKKSL